MKKKIKKSKFGRSIFDGHDFKTEDDMLFEMNIPFYVEELVDRVKKLEATVQGFIDCMGNIKKEKIV